MRCILLALVLLTLSGCVIDRTGKSAVADWQRQLTMQDTRVAEVERKIALMEASVRARGRQDVEALEDLTAIRGEVRRLRGELEIAQHQLRGLEDIAGAVRDESDIRLSGLEERLGELEVLLGVDMPATAVTVADAAVPDGAEPGESPAAAVPSDAPDGLLELGREHLEAGRAVAGRAVIQRYLSENPQSPRVFEGHFLLAETWFAEGSFQQAVLAYEDVVQGDPEGEWAPPAMLRQGECFQSMGRGDEARLFWEDLVARYPQSDEALRARDRLGQ